MKAVSRLFVLVLILAPSFAAAQTDSMYVHFQLLGSPVAWSFETKIFPTNGAPYNSGSKSGTLLFNLDSRLTLPQSDRVCFGCGGGNELSFNVDRSTNTITQLTVKYERSEYAGQGTMIYRYQMTFGPIPYAQNGTSLVAGGHFKALSLDENVLYQGGTPSGNEQGEWSASSTPTDSVLIEIAQMARSAVDAPLNTRPHLAVTNIGERSLQIALPPVEFSQPLEVLDILGRTVMVLPLTHESDIRLSTAGWPQGCYFVRFGSETQKVIVQ